MKKFLSLIFLTFSFSTTAFSDDVIYEYSEKLSNKELSSNQIVEICKEYDSKNIDLGQYDQATFNIGRGIENYCTTMKMRAEFKSDAEYDYIQKGWSKINLERLNFKYLSNKYFKLEIPKNRHRSCEIDIVNEKRVTLYEISRRCGVEKIITYQESMEEPKCTSEECNLVKIEYEDEDSLKNNWINIIDHFYADANNDGYMDLIIRFQADGNYSMGAQTMTAAVTSFRVAKKTQLNSFTKRYVDQSATYGEYLSKCSESDKRSLYFHSSGITEIEVFKGKNLDIDCLVKKFEEHQRTYPVKSFLSDKSLKPQKIILNKETSKSFVNNLSYEKYEMSSIVDQKCSENCVYTTEALIVHKNQYWYIKGSNDRGLKAEMYRNDDLLITNMMSTHKRKYNYYANNIERVSDNLMTSFAKDQNVYLNACGANPLKYYDKPLNIQNIVTEVPNRITKLEKSKYDRIFQTIANSSINLDGNKIDISVSNFRELIIKDNNGDVLATRKITGASSLYELKHKGNVVAWGVGWNKYCENIQPDFTALRIFLPVKKDNKISIEQQLTRLNVNPFYKATLNSEKLIISDAVTVSGSSNAANYYYGGQKFYELDHVNGFKSIDTYVELHEKIDVLQISPARMINILAGYYETEILNKYTRANFDNIYKDLLANYHWNLYYKFGNNIFQSNLASSIDDVDIIDEIKNAFRAFEKGEIQYRQFPPIVWEIPNLKKNCFKQDNYETLKELVRNCYLFHSSYLLEYGFNNTKWFAVQTEFKDSYDLLSKDKDKRFETFLNYQIQNMKSFVWEDLGMDGTVVDELISTLYRPEGSITKYDNDRYVVIDGCEYKNCTKKGLVFIDTEDNYAIALIRHSSYQPDKTDYAVESDDWLILSQQHDEYRDLPQEFFDAVTKWRLIEGQAVGDDTMPLPRIIRFVGGYNDIKVFNNSEDYNARNDRKGWLGIRIMDNETDIDGIRIVRISPAGPADIAELKEDDIIISYNSNLIKTNEDLLYQLSKSKADEIIDLEVIRDSKKINLKVKLGAK